MTDWATKRSPINVCSMSGCGAVGCDRGKVTLFTGVVACEACGGTGSIAASDVAGAVKLRRWSLLPRVIEEDILDSAMAILERDDRRMLESHVFSKYVFQKRTGWVRRGS